jgi:hypothetical protein
VGHETELREGRFIAERAIEIGPEPSALVEIRLP